MKLFLMILVGLSTLCHALTLIDLSRKGTEYVRRYREENGTFSASCKTASSLLGEWETSLHAFLNIAHVYEDPSDATNNSFTGTYEYGTSVYSLYGTFDSRSCSTGISFDSAAGIAWVGKLKCADNGRLQLKTKWIEIKDGFFNGGDNSFYKTQGNDACSSIEPEKIQKKTETHHNSAFQEKVQLLREKLKKVETVVLD